MRIRIELSSIIEERYKSAPDSILDELPFLERLFSKTKKKAMGGKMSMVIFLKTSTKY